MYETCFKAFVFLADQEWSGHQDGLIMPNVAGEFARTHPTHRPLLVTVHEHAGWWLQYAFGFQEVPDGAVVGTANDQARFPEERQRLQNNLQGTRFTYLPEVRRT